MNIESSTKLLITQVGRSAQDDIDMAQIELINAMSFYKAHKFDFNKGWTQVHLPQGVDRLNSPSQPAGFPAMRPGMPHGMKRAMVIQIVGLVTSGDVDTGLGIFSYQPVDQPPLRLVSEDYLWSCARGVGEISTSQTGWPQIYCYLGDGSIRIYPSPFTSMLADVYFLQDAHRPRYVWDSGSAAWNFEQLLPISTSIADYWQWEPMRPDFENLWLQHAEPLIRARARYQLFKNFYSDRGSSELAAIDVIEELKNLQFEAASGTLETLRRIPTPL